MSNLNHARHRLAEVRRMLYCNVLISRHGGLAPIVGWLESANRTCLLVTLADGRQILVEPREIAAVSLFARPGDRPSRRVAADTYSNTVLWTSDTMPEVAVVGPVMLVRFGDLNEVQ
jgi:hypothetical protein